MSTSIELPNEVYERLAKQAQVRGMTPAETVAQALEEAEVARSKAFWERLEAKGLVARKNHIATVEATHFQPIQVQGQPLSEVIIEERR